MINVINTRANGKEKKIYLEKGIDIDRSRSYYWKRSNFKRSFRQSDIVAVNLFQKQ